AIKTFSLDFGNTLAYPDNPNSSEGFDSGQVTTRRITGSIDPTETLVATRDAMSDFRAGTRRIVHARMGTTTGNKVGITIPQAHLTAQQPGDRNGISVVSLPFEAVGQDAGLFLCFY